MKFYDHKLTDKDKDELSAIARDVIESGQYIGGERVAEFEKAMKEYFGIPFASCNSGTDALVLALKALNIGEGDEVIVPGFTYFATIEPIYHCGAVPVLADISRETFNIDPEGIEKLITKKTKAIMPVHLFGLAADMSAIMEIAKKNDLVVIEDAAQAFGALHSGEKVGTFGQVNCFSFFPTKNLGGYGDAGGITIKNSKVEEKLRLLKNHGQKIKYTSDIMGMNTRMDPIQASLLLHRFKQLDEHLDIRKKNAEKWRQELDGRNGVIQVPNQTDHTYNNFSILVEDRENFIKELESQDIPYIVYYEKSVYDQKAYIDVYGQQGPMENIEFVKNHIISLPIHY